MKPKRILSKSWIAAPVAVLTGITGVQRSSAEAPGARPQKMKAIGLYEYLPADNDRSLVDTEIARPVPAGRDLLVAVKAISVNPLDAGVRSGSTPVYGEKSQPPHILDWDAAGVVAAVGPDVKLDKVDDEVFYAGEITRPGSYSQFQLVDEQIVGRKPHTLSFAETAAMPLARITAWDSLFDQLGISPTDESASKSILIIGGGGGVGSMAIQLAAKVAKLNVIATASRESSRDCARKLGASKVVNHSNPLDVELAAQGIKTVDYILVLKGIEQHWPAIAQVIAPRGRIVSIVSSNGKPLDLDMVWDKSVTFSCESMFTRTAFHTSDMIEQQRLLDAIARLVDDGKLVSTASSILHPINAANLRKAHAIIEQGHTAGKVVLEGWE